MEAPEASTSRDKLQLNAYLSLLSVSSGSADTRDPFISILPPSAHSSWQGTGTLTSGISQ